ncbi:hypothetical protein ACU4GD_42625 [Cupriavidus basilensis]
MLAGSAPNATLRVLASAAPRHPSPCHHPRTQDLHMPLTAEQLIEYMDFATSLAQAAGNASLPYFRSAPAVEDKGGRRFDPVTEADKAAERAMRDLIRHGIRSTASWARKKTAWPAARH